LFSVSVWSGGSDEIAPGTRDLFHWVSALIALPAIAYAGRPFFTSALAALRARRTNMDVPISLAVSLAPTVSLHETFVSGQHAYFDSAVTLLFFLLVGRYLDHRVRRKARLGAEHLLAIGETPASVIEPDGTRRDLPPREIRPGMVVLVAPGSRMPVDGSVLEGMSDLDVSLVNGESAPRAVAAGSSVFAGTLNLTGPLRVLVNKAGEATLLAEIVRLIEASEDRRCRHVRIADRVARYYAPVVHTMALTAFLGWTLIGAMAWQDAMMIAISVLIITCPCALALAVPVVQVVASQRLMRSGILLKNGEALERLSLIDHVILDKTGTLTLGRLTLIESGKSDRLPIAAAIAANSRHPLARALSAACPVAFTAAPVAEQPGQGLVWHGPDGDWRLGSASFVGMANDEVESRSSRPSVYLRGPDGRTDRFVFEDQLRPDAKEACADLARRFDVEILSGDRAEVVSRTAGEVGIASWRADATKDKRAFG
jgi:Cu2+-exporting ATPase